MSKKWYAYDDKGALDTASSYNEVTVKPTCINGLKICAIYVTDGAPHPTNLSNNIRQYIFNALVTQRAQPENAGSKRYVYLKG